MNPTIQADLINSAFEYGVSKLLFLGSNCVYPNAVPQPMRENALLAGMLEPTNERYAFSKLADIKLWEDNNWKFGIRDGVDYVPVVPTNEYGPGDNYNTDKSHVAPALNQRRQKSKLGNTLPAAILGTGTHLCEFLQVEEKGPEHPPPCEPSFIHDRAAQSLSRAADVHRLNAQLHHALQRDNFLKLHHAEVVMLRSTHFPEKSCRMAHTVKLTHILTSQISGRVRHNHIVFAEDGYRRD